MTKIEKSDRGASKKRDTSLGRTATTKDNGGDKKISTTKTEIQELRDMQVNIQKQLQDMQNTFLDKFSQLKPKEEQRPATQADGLTQSLGQNIPDQSQIPTDPSMGGINVDVRKSQQLNGENNNQMIVNLYQCI